ncbi:hypothetical protein TWF694_007595 [Orbilia ellipsospora]|uniref:Uncharacterized protein n=1 Tax=Orbilia ellipsospora TaxID=2528407 RepID=A0AAV9XKS8_9PEZI
MYTTKEKGHSRQNSMTPLLVKRPLRFLKTPAIIVITLFMFLLGLNLYQLSPSFGNIIGDASVSIYPTGDINDRPLVLYAYKETENARKNALFFITHGLHSAADFIFILNGPTNLTDSIPSSASNIRVIQREDKCFDMGAYGEVLNANDQRLVKRYNKFILLNASVRGPFMPTWSRECWSDAYLARITDTNKLVGMTYNCKPRRQEVHPHIQSMILATDRTGISLLLPILSECFTSHMRAIYAEGNSTRAMWNAGFTATALMTSFSSKENYAHECNHTDVLGGGAYYGMAVHPYETIFMKANRNYGQRVLDRFTEWTDEAGYSSYEVCGRGRNEIPALGGWGRWKEAAVAKIRG